MRLFYKHAADHTPLALATIAEAQFLDAKGFVRQYREHLSDFPTWEARLHAAEWLVFSENVGRHLSLEKVAISQARSPKDPRENNLTNLASNLRAIFERASIEKPSP